MGLYHVQMSKYSSDPMEIMTGFIYGAAAYSEGAKKHPEDDELHGCKCSNADLTACFTSSSLST
jgi:hypothetical protein